MAGRRTAIAFVLLAVLLPFVGVATGYWVGRHTHDWTGNSQDWNFELDELIDALIGLIAGLVLSAILLVVVTMDRERV